MLTRSPGHKLVKELYSSRRTGDLKGNRPAVRLGRGVKWSETRSEAMLSMQGRGQVQYAEMGFSRDGRITGLGIHKTVDPDIGHEIFVGIVAAAA